MPGSATIRVAAAAVLAAAAGACGVPGRALAQTGLEAATAGGLGGPLTSLGNTDTRVGSLRGQLESYFARNQRAPSIATPAWLIQPSLGVDVGVTDNAQRLTSPRRGDVFTLITPAITISRDAPRLKLDISYAPTLSVYASQTNQTGVTQSGNARALAILVPDAVYLDVRGGVSQSSLTGNGYSTQNALNTYNRQNQVETYTVSVSPYAVHRFGGWGVGRIGYTFSRTIQELADNQNGAITAANNAALAQALAQSSGNAGYGTTGNLSTHRERASFTTGENLGRFNNLTFIDASQYSGGGSYRGAHRNEIGNQLGYAVTRNVTGLVGVGYQDLAYSGTPAYRLQEITWDVGGRYTPSPDTSFTLLFGRRDGAASVSLDGTFAPTAQTRLFARYSTGITSDVQEAQNILQSTSLDGTGQLTDSTTGAPVGTGGGGISGTQNGVYRVKRLSVNGLLLRSRDSYSVGLSYEDRMTLTNSTSLLTNATIPAGTNTTSFSASVSWQHDLAPDVSTYVSGQYGTSNSTSLLVTGTGSQQQRTISFSAGVSKRFTETLTGSIRYNFVDQSGGTVNGTVFNPLLGRTFNTGAYTENSVLVGLRKSF